MIPSVLAQFLAGNQVCYEVIAHPEQDSALQAARRRGIALNRLAKSIMLRDRYGFVMAVYPADHSINLDRIRALTGRKMDFAAQAEYAPLFAEIDVAALPPLGSIYGVDMLVDSSFTAGGEVFVEAGVRSALVKLAQGEFNKMIVGALTGPISTPLVVAARQIAAAAGRRGLGMRKNIAVANSDGLYQRFAVALGELQLPATAAQLLRCAVEGDYDCDRLVALVAQEPDIAGVLVQMAQSPLFGGALPQPTLRSAIMALGAETTLGFAIGCKINQSYRPRTGGVFGHMGFWRQAIYCTAAMHLLARTWPQGERWQAYLGGLLHNFGYLLLGYLDAGSFQDLNRLLLQAPDRDILEIESLLLGESHCHLGARLIQQWQLPDAVTFAICEHHNENYTGRHSRLVHSILVANRLLKRYGIGDARRLHLPQELLSHLGMDLASLHRIMDEVLNHCRFLDDLARQLALTEIS